MSGKINLDDTKTPSDMDPPSEPVKAPSSRNLNPPEDPSLAYIAESLRDNIVTATVQNVDPAIEAVEQANSLKDPGMVFPEGHPLAGKTFMHHFASKGYVDAFMTLHKRGADIYAVDDKGMRPLDYATKEVKAHLEKVIFEEARKKVYDLKNEKITKKETDFEKSGEKTVGVSGGYIATRKIDKATHILKKAFKSTAAITLEDVEEQKALFKARGKNIDRFGRVLTDADLENKIKHQLKEDRFDLITEYITGQYLYPRVLGKDAPIINLVESPESKDGAGTNQIYLSSKFFEKFKTLAEFTETKGDSIAGSKHPNLKAITGVEKVLAACLLGGECDYHANNIGVVESKDDTGKPIYKAVKIDHGRSGNEYSSVAEMRETFCKGFVGFGYNNVPFNITKFKDAVHQTIMVKDEEIENTIKKGIADLKVKGVDASDIYGGSLEEIEESFIRGFKQRQKQLKVFHRVLEIIDKIDGTPEWKNGGWMRDINTQDPIKWAHANNRTIEGQTVPEWFPGYKLALAKEKEDNMRRALEAHKPPSGYFVTPNPPAHHSLGKA